MIYVFLADGFEEIEALTTVDILRRCGLTVNTISINHARVVHGAHGIPVYADDLFRQNEVENSDCLVLPGGMPGAKYLAEHEGLKKVLLKQNENQGLIAAICAAPMVLGRHDILRGKNATCYPGFEKELKGAFVHNHMVVEDGNIITAKGPAAAREFAFAIAARFVEKKIIDENMRGMLYK